MWVFLIAQLPVPRPLWSALVSTFTICWTLVFFSKAWVLQIHTEARTAKCWVINWGFLQESSNFWTRRVMENAFWVLSPLAPRVFSVKPSWFDIKTCLRSLFLIILFFPFSRMSKFPTPIVPACMKYLCWAFITLFANRLIVLLCCRWIGINSLCTDSQFLAKLFCLCSLFPFF